VRTVKIVVVLLLAVAGVAGCGLFGDDPGPSRDEQIQKIVDEHASFTVMLKNDATAAQRSDVETALRALPGFTGLTFTDKQAAYEKMKQMFSADPSDVASIGPENLPESFEVRMTDIAAVRKLRDDERPVKSLPGVDQLVFTCLTVPECKAKYSPKPTAAPP
jgi:cell division transport system permease protein